MTRPPYFNGQHYNWQNNRMENCIQADDYEFWMIIKSGPYIPVRIREYGKTIPKKAHKFDSDDYRKMEKNARLKKLLYFGLGPNECTRI